MKLIIISVIWRTIKPKLWSHRNNNNFRFNTSNFPIMMKLIDFGESADFVKLNKNSFHQRPQRWLSIAQIIYEFTFRVTYEMRGDVNIHAYSCHNNQKIPNLIELWGQLTFMLSICFVNACKNLHLIDFQTYSFYLAQHHPKLLHISVKTYPTSPPCSINYVGWCWLFKMQC